MKNFINNLVNSGNATLVANFGGLSVPDMHRPFEIDCHITVPRDYQPCMQDMHDGHSLPFVPVMVVFPDGDTQCDKLFLGTLLKTLKVNGTFVRNHGTVVDALRQFSNWDDAFRLCLAGRTFRITGITTYEVKAFPPAVGMRETKVYDFDFV